MVNKESNPHPMAQKAYVSRFRSYLIKNGLSQYIAACRPDEIVHHSILRIFDLSVIARFGCSSLSEFEELQSLQIDHIGSRPLASLVTNALCHQGISSAILTPKWVSCMVTLFFHVSTALFFTHVFSPNSPQCPFTPCRIVSTNAEMYRSSYQWCSDSYASYSSSILEWPVSLPLSYGGAMTLTFFFSPRRALGTAHVSPLRSGLQHGSFYKRPKKNY